MIQFISPWIFNNVAVSWFYIQLYAFLCWDKTLRKWPLKKHTFSENKTAEYVMIGYDFACDSSEYIMIHISTQLKLQT